MWDGAYVVCSFLQALVKFCSSKETFASLKSFGGWIKIRKMPRYALFKLELGRDFYQFYSWCRIGPIVGSEQTFRRRLRRSFPTNHLGKKRKV